MKINFQRSISFGHDIKENILAGGWLLLGSRKSLTHIRPSIIQLIFWATLACGSNILFSWLVGGGRVGIGAFNEQGLISYALWPFLALLIGIFLAQKYNHSRILLVPTLLWLILDSGVVLLQSLIQYLVQQNLSPIFLDPFLSPLFTALFIWQSIAIIWVLSKELGWLWWEKIIVIFATCITLIIWQTSSRKEPIWLVEETPPMLLEQEFYAQPQLLQQSLEQIHFSDLGRSHWYFLGVAGASYQEVFKSEIVRIKELFDTRFDTAGRSIALVNHPTSALELPFASKTSIEMALNKIGQQMNREQDVLFLYMTSHGTENEFQLEYSPLQFDSIDPVWLKQTLDRAGIRWRVIVISACRSGSFIPALQSPDTLIITASADDKDSFGCTNEADYTYFGRAFFDQSLREHTSIKHAFIEAQKTVASWEQAQGFEPSEPQWSLGRNMALMLPQFEQQLFPQPLQKTP